uniref:Uncharacterized protein n=1 Tax=Avena sativa TaxID=4498 RepID=A0ACD5VV54_AVESA
MCVFPEEFFHRPVPSLSSPRQRVDIHIRESLRLCTCKKKKMEGRTKLCFLVVMVLLASPATLADRCEHSRFESLICMRWSCQLECISNNPGKIIEDAYCTVKHGVIRYCNCVKCVKD